MSSTNFFGNGEPQACSFSGVAIVNPFKLIKNPGQVFPGDTAAGVDDGDFNGFIIKLLTGNGYFPLIGEFYGIPDEIKKDLVYYF